jgi:prepilin signal peptidase PulO-like enzyme (type II secretory pathway)
MIFGLDDLSRKGDSMIFEICIMLVLVIASIEDVRTKEIPAWEIAACGAISIAACVLNVSRGKGDALGIFMSLLPGAGILFIALMSGQKVGFGDGFLLLAAGPALGPWTSALGLVTALFAGCVFSGILVVIRKAKSSTRIPFVPFMTLGMGAMLIEKI